MPWDTTSFVALPAISDPFQLMEPEAGFTSPTIDLSVVDFPAPFAPMRETILPSGTSIEIPWMACMPS